MKHEHLLRKSTYRLYAENLWLFQLVPFLTAGWLPERLVASQPALFAYRCKEISTASAKPRRRQRGLALGVNTGVGLLSKCGPSSRDRLRLSCLELSNGQQYTVDSRFRFGSGYNSDHSFPCQWAHFNTLLDSIVTICCYVDAPHNIRCKKKMQSPNMSWLISGIFLKQRFPLYTNRAKNLTCDRSRNESKAREAYKGTARPDLAFGRKRGDGVYKCSLDKIRSRVLHWACVITSLHMNNAGLVACVPWQVAGVCQCLVCGVHSAL